MRRALKLVVAVCVVLTVYVIVQLLPLFSPLQVRSQLNAKNTRDLPLTELNKKEGSEKNKNEKLQVSSHSERGNWNKRKNKIKKQPPKKNAIHQKLINPKQNPKTMSKEQIAFLAKQNTSSLYSSKLWYDILKLCPPIDTRLLIVIYSHPTQYDARQAIRETWGNWVLDSSFLVFLLGKTNDTTTQLSVEKEDFKHGDIVQIKRRDSYENLATKATFMVHWVSNYCKKAQYVVKSDIDVFINIPSLEARLAELERQAHRKFFLCLVMTNRQPYRDPKSKWYVSKKDFSEYVFPDYCQGTAYAFTGNMAGDLFKYSQLTPTIKPEDVYLTGIVARHLKVEHINDNRFTAYFDKFDNPCDYKTKIAVHNTSLRMLRLVWKFFNGGIVGPQTIC